MKSRERFNLDNLQKCITVTSLHNALLHPRVDEKYNEELHNAVRLGRASYTPCEILNRFHLRVHSMDAIYKTNRILRSK